MDRKFHFSKLIRSRIGRAAGFLAALFFLITVSPEPRLLQITFLGDVMLGRGVNRAAGQAADWQPFLALKPVTAMADILAANLESPLTIAPVTTSGYALCAPPSRVETLKDASFSLVTLANNHSHDCGDLGFDQTRLTLQAFGIRAVEPSPNVEYISSQGRKLAFLAMDDVSRPLERTSIMKAVREAKAHADVVIVSIHWGKEYQTYSTQRQKTLAAILAEAGADIIIGHHPHVIQPMQMIDRGKDRVPTLVFYSLGNALFDQYGLADTRTGEAVSLIFGPGNTLMYSTVRFEIDPNRGVIKRILP